MVAVLPWRLLDGCCSSLEASGWLLFFLGGFLMVAVLPWRLLDGCCSSLVASGSLILFVGRFLMVAVPSRWLLVQDDEK